MPQIKNRTKRKHAALRRERTTRNPGKYTDAKGRVVNRKDRRHGAKLGRPDVRRYRKGRWVLQLAFAIRGLLRRCGLLEEAPHRERRVREVVTDCGVDVH
jgi:hypothetical protein